MFTWLGWIPGLRFAISFFCERYIFSTIQKFYTIPLKLDFEIFFQFLKLRGWRSYAWGIYFQNHLQCSSYYTGHFHIQNSGNLSNFALTDVILTSVKFIFRAVLLPLLFSASSGTHKISIKRCWTFLNSFWYLWKVRRIMSTYPNAHAKVKKLISDVQFPGNQFKLGIIGNNFWSHNLSYLD